MLTREVFEDLYCRQRQSLRGMAKQLGMSFGSIQYYKRKYSIATLERDVFDWSEDTAYILGAMAGDGCAYISHNGRGTIMYRVDLQVGNENFAKRVYDSAQRVHLRPHWYKPQNLKNSIKAYTRYKVGFLSKRLFQLVKETKQEPSSLLSLIKDNKQALFFIVGFFDAEGHYRSEPAKSLSLVQLSNTNISLLKIVNLLLEKVGYSFRLRLCRASDDRCKTLYVLQNTRRESVCSFMDAVKEVKRIPLPFLDKLR